MKTLLKRLFIADSNIAKNKPFYPQIPEKVDENKYLKDIIKYFGLKNKPELIKEYYAYREYYFKKNYGEMMKEGKTLSIEEAYLIYKVLKIFRPKNIVEIGTQEGRSTRKLIDMKEWLGLKSFIYCFDIVDQVKYFTPVEAQLNLKDVTHSFRRDVLEKHNPNFIFLDAHPYHLLFNIIHEVLHTTDNIILAIHDCGRGLCNPDMTSSKNDPNVVGKNGIWERYILADLFNVANPLSHNLDDCQNKFHKLKIFDTAFGLALIMPRKLLKR